MNGLQTLAVVVSLALPGPVPIAPETSIVPLLSATDLSRP